MGALEAQRVDQNEMLISFGFLPLRLQDCTFVIVCLCSKVHSCFSICSWTGFCFCFFYGTFTAFSPLYIACFFAVPTRFLQQLCSSHVCSAKPISACSWASTSSIRYVLARNGHNFGSKPPFHTDLL